MEKYLVQQIERYPCTFFVAEPSLHLLHFFHDFLALMPVSEVMQMDPILMIEYPKTFVVAVEV